MSRPNRCIKDENGNELWISRSTVVIPIVFKLDVKTGNIFTLVEKRGPVVSHPGEWCCPCGYLDWDETLKEACQREVREETGVCLDQDKIVFGAVDSDKKTANQSVDLWYMCWADGSDIDLNKVETKDEVLEVRWLKVGQVFGRKRLFGLLGKSINIRIFKKSIMKSYGTWAFKKHPVKIMEMLRMVVNHGKVYEEER